MTTMLDVSRRAGVSKATVSRVLNGTGQVKESTRQKVFKAMQALDYRPNFLARSLANRTSNSIGLVVSTFDGFYFGRLLQQASRQTESHGKQLIVTDGHDTPEREQEAVQMLADRQCDAIILYTRYMSEKTIISLINTIETPLVVINRDVSLARDRAIFFEQEDAAFQAVDYLISGYRLHYRTESHANGKIPSDGLPQGAGEKRDRLGPGESEIRRLQYDTRVRSVP